MTTTRRNNPLIHRVSNAAVLLSTVAAMAACSRPTNVQPAQPKGRQHSVAVTALPVEPATVSPSPDVNPFSDGAFYADPGYAQKVRASADRAAQLATKMARVEKQPTALWLDRIAAIAQLPEWLVSAREQSRTSGEPTVPVVVVYNLPNRDCSAKASNGELAIERDGERRYREEYIDVIASHLAADPEQRVAIVLEPDSLPNLISNLGVEKCAVSEQVYKHSVAYAISKLSLPNVFIYLDVAHAGWLGWDASQRRMVELIVEVLGMSGGTSRIRGFASNVSNYNALHGDWGKRLEPSNPAPNELTYAQNFLRTAEAHGLSGKGFLIDTSRNGQADIRSRWGNWCNIRGAGIGELPRANPEPGIDAYFWVKPPGESDGTADPTAERFDANCASSDAAPGAPEAGQWFHAYFVELVKNANPSL